MYHLQYSYSGRDADGTRVDVTNLRFSATVRNSLGQSVSPDPFTWRRVGIYDTTENGYPIATGTIPTLRLGRTNPNTPLDRYYITLKVWVAGKSNLLDTHALAFSVRSHGSGGPDDGNGDPGQN